MTEPNPALKAFTTFELLVEIGARCEKTTHIIGELRLQIEKGGK